MHPPLQLSADSWPHSYIYALHEAPRLYPDLLNLLSPKTFKQPSLHLFWLHRLSTLLKLHGHYEAAVILHTYKPLKYNLPNQSISSLPSCPYRLCLVCWQSHHKIHKCLQYRYIYWSHNNGIFGIQGFQFLQKDSWKEYKLFFGLGQIFLSKIS